MLQNLINNRYSARTFLDKPIEQEKIDYILNCAINAPSKQSLYPYKIYALTDTKEAQQFKEWLYWEDTWCVNGAKAEEKDRHSNDKRFNGQYNAPLLLLFANRNPDEEKFKDEDFWKLYIPYSQQQDLVDLTISASFALLAAEEQGLRTCFGACHSIDIEHKIFGNNIISCPLMLGIGYAEADQNHNNRMMKPIMKNDELQGLDTRNLDQTFPKERHNNRVRKPAFNELIQIV